jgi:hypothetical protein
MGFFGTYQFDGESWTERDPAVGPVGSEPWLWIDVHDSDFTTVRYAPFEPGSGTAYLGFTPRDYFENSDASSPTDVGQEARGLARWWLSRRQGASEDDLSNKAAEIALFLASDDAPTDENSEDDADIFVEIKTARFLSALDLPMPDDLAGRA